MKLPKEDRVESILSVIIPIYQEYDLLEKLSKLSVILQNCEIIVVDTSPVPLMNAYDSPPIRYFYRPDFKYRSQAMNHGANQSSHQNLWFLHADCIPPFESAKHIKSALEIYSWGFFKKSYFPSTLPLKLLSWVLNVACLFTHQFVVGTNGLFIRKDFFMAVGMYPIVPICEDLEIIRHIEAHNENMGGIQLQRSLLVSSRKYLALGGFKRICINLIVYTLYKLGTKPPSLLNIYRVRS